MTDRSANAAHLASTPLLAPAYTQGAHGVSETLETLAAKPVKRTRRPRPTFEDGALTRTFKFPSKSYPRSSYYVTSTEIIIRIKKARKKWKLVIPKKRVVSYRTNRWFAKPRWIAIELTFTQAVKLGLADARPRTAPTDQDAAGNAGPPADASPPGNIEADNLSSTDEAAPAFSTFARDVDSAHQSEDLIQTDTADDFELSEDTDEVASEEELQLDAHVPAQEIAERNEQDHIEPTSLPRSENESAQIVPFAAQVPPPPKALKRHGVRRTILTLAAASAGLVIWSGLEGIFLGNDDCVRNGGQPRCNAPIITGSIGTYAPPQSFPEAQPISLETPESPGPSALAEIAEQTLAAGGIGGAGPESADSPSAPAKLVEAEIFVLADRDIAMPLAPPLFTASLPAPRPDIIGACERVNEDARRIVIIFDYASASIDPTSRKALQEFGESVRGCSSTKVIIEGHTDSDGRADLNRALSLRRAQAVQKLLLQAGMNARQLETVGYGHLRPKEPNVSRQSKRINRRVTFVVASSQR